MESIKVFESRGLNGKEDLVEEVKQKAAALLDSYYKLGLNESISSEAIRCRSLAITNLEQSVMWFVKGVSRS